MSMERNIITMGESGYIIMPAFCYNDILLLLIHSQVKVEKHQVRKVLQECWKLTPAANGLTYTTYQFNYNRECRYEPIKRVGRFYTVTREQLESM